MRVMEGVHRFAAECLVIFGEHSLVGLHARRLAQRMRLQLVVGVDPDRAEVRDIVAKRLLERRERIETLLAK